MRRPVTARRPGRAADGHDRALGTGHAVSRLTSKGERPSAPRAARPHHQHIVRLAGQVHQHPASRSPLYTRLHQRVVGNLAHAPISASRSCWQAISRHAFPSSRDRPIR